VNLLTNNAFVQKLFLYVIAILKELFCEGFAGSFTDESKLDKTTFVNNARPNVVFFISRDSCFLETAKKCSLVVVGNQ